MSELDAAIDASVPIGFLLQKKDSYDDIDKTMELVQNQRKSRMGVEYVRWTKEEEDKLLHLVGVVGGKNWVEIARLMDNDRSAKACNHKYQDLMKMQAQNLPLEYTDMKDMSGEPSSLDENLAGGHVIDFNNSINLNNTSSRVLWTPEEDKMLLQFIAEHSNSQHIPWSKLDIPGRSRKACSNRWDYQLKCKFANLNVYKRPILDAEGNQTGEEFCLPQATFSSAEDMLLHVTDGSKDIENNKHWTAEEDETLVQYVKSHGFQNIPWTRMSTIVPTRSTVACRKRWSNYLKRKFDDAQQISLNHDDDNSHLPAAKHALLGSRTPGSEMVDRWSVDMLDGSALHQSVTGGGGETHGDLMQSPEPGTNAAAHELSIDEADDVSHRMHLTPDGNKHGMMWTPEEDEMLLKYVASFGYKNIPWCKINDGVIPGRHAMSCESRWRKYLKMKVFSKSPMHLTGHPGNVMHGSSNVSTVEASLLPTDL